MTNPRTLPTHPGGNPAHGSEPVSRNLLTRRSFLAGAAAALPAAYAFSVQGCARGAPADAQEAAPLFSISLAEWSLHRTLNAGELTNLDFPRVTREEFGIEGVEYVNSFFKDKAEDTPYLTDLKSRCTDHGVQSLIIMCDGEGALGIQIPPPGLRRSRTTTGGWRPPVSWNATPSG